MIADIPVYADVREYAATSMELKTRDEIFSAMVVYGFLNYKDGYVSIPNKELMDKFTDLVQKEPSLGNVYRLTKESGRMLMATKARDIKTMTEILQFVHNTESPMQVYNNEDSGKRHECKVEVLRENCKSRCQHQERKAKQQMRLYIVRHGETDWNKERKVQGGSDIPLNEYGRHLARQTAEGMKDIPFDLAYTSPLIRAKETAKIILAGRDIPLIETNGLKEMGFGAYEGMYCGAKTNTAENEAFQKFFSDTGNFVPAQGGESVGQVMERTGRFLKELCENEELRGKHILLSTHGAAMTAFLNHIRGNLKPADFWKWQVPANCAVTIVDVKNGVPVIVEENKIYYKEPVKRWNMV